MSTAGMRRGGLVLTVLGLLGLITLYWMSFFWVDTEVNQGVVQRIFYVHVPAAWTSFLAIGFAALASGMYLWLRDDRLDRAALCAIEGGLVFATLVLITGPLWGKIAWGTYWTWEPRLTLTLLLWFIFVGYFMVRNATEDPEKGEAICGGRRDRGCPRYPFHSPERCLVSLAPSRPGRGEAGRTDAACRHAADAAFRGSRLLAALLRTLPLPLRGRGATCGKLICAHALRPDTHR